MQPSVSVSSRVTDAAACVLLKCSPTFCFAFKVSGLLSGSQQLPLPAVSVGCSALLRMRDEVKGGLVMLTSV